MIRLYLVQKVQNVLTSGYYLNHEQLVVESATTSLMNLLLTPPWKKLYTLLGNRGMYHLFSEYSIFYELSSEHILQVSGPSLWQSKDPCECNIFQYRFCLSSIYYHLSFSRYPGFSNNHLLSQLLRLNNDLNRIEPNAAVAHFAYKTIRNEVVIMLIHTIFKDCYPKWKNLKVEEEIKECRIRYHLQLGTLKRRRVPFPPRLNECKRLLGKLLYNVSCCCFACYLNECTPLSPEYLEYKQQWK